MSSSITDYAMLAALNIRQWSARKLDRSVTAEVDKNHGAKDGGRYNKLLIDKAALDPIEQVAGAARQYHYKVTLPWGINGEWLLPASLFMDYSTKMGEYRNSFENAVAVLIAAYPMHVQAARQRLGTMYNATEYPTNIKDRFEFKVDFSPVPTANDFRVKLSEDHLAAIRRDITVRIEERQNQAVREVFDRARKIVSKIHEQTVDTDRKIYDSTIDNAREFIELLPALNLTNDPILCQIEADMRELLVPVEDLRKNKRIRADTAKAANAILTRLPWA
jgi:hypothetical protein